MAIWGSYRLHPVVPRSDLVVMREEFVKAVAENLRLRAAIAERDAQLEERGRRIASLEAELEAERARHAAETLRREAEHAARIAERDERIKRLEVDNEAMGDDNKKLAASDRYHNNPHSPPRSGTWAAEYRRRRAIEARYARQPAWRPPGRSVGHPGTTRKLVTNRPDEHRIPGACPACRRTDLSEDCATTKQVAELETIVVSRKNIVFHDMICNGCGTKVAASRRGTVRGTWFGPRMLAALWNIHTTAHCSASTIAKIATHTYGVPTGRTGGVRAMEAANDQLAETADAIRQKMDVLRDYGEIDECVRKMIVEVEEEEEEEAGGGGPGKARRRRRRRAAAAAAAAGTSPDPPGRRRRMVRKGYIHAARDNSGNVNVWADPSRGVNVLLNRFADRVNAGTAADRLANYDRCAVRQNDHTHDLRESEEAAMTGDPAAARLHEMFGAVLAEVREYAAGHRGGAFPEPGAGKAAKEFKERILGLADAYEKAGHERKATRFRRSASGLVKCVEYPALTATTHKSEQCMRDLGRDRDASPMLVSDIGRKRYSDGRTCHKSWIAKGINPFDEMQSVLGVDPPREWAQISAVGERAAAARDALGRGAMPIGWQSGAMQPQAPPQQAPPQQQQQSTGGHAAAAASDPSATAKRPAGAAKPNGQEAGARRIREAPKSAPKPRRRHLAMAAVPDAAAAAAEKAGRSKACAQGHPTTARAAPVVAPDGPGPPPARGPQDPIAAARPTSWSIGR